MDIQDEYLIVAYWKALQDPKRNFNTQVVGRLLLLNEGQAQDLPNLLRTRGLVKSNLPSANLLSLTPEGTKTVGERMGQEGIYILDFIACNYIAPAVNMSYGFTYTYKIHQYEKEDKLCSITVSTTGLKAMTLNIPAGKITTERMVFLQYARFYIARQLEQRSLREHEEVVLRAEDLATFPTFDPDFLPDVATAIFVVETSSGLKKKPEPKEANAVANPVIDPSEEERIHLTRTPLIMKPRLSFNPVMGVEPLAFDMSMIIESLPSDKGQMIGIFGKWGRGKTFFLKVLKELLLKSDKRIYKLVEFHAWKYQETPASWAYLYEQLATAYLGPKKHFYTYWPRLIVLNIRRFGWWPLLQTLLSIAITILIPVLANQYLPRDWKSTLWAIIPTSMLLGTGLLLKIKEAYSTRAVDLLKKYGTKNTFKASMGIQADIQDELVKLMKSWIRPKRLHEKKIVLLVEDIDRCNEEKIIQNIDALRVMLEEEEISQRLIIITAIDERILRNAIQIKYASLLRSRSLWPSDEKEPDSQTAKLHSIQQLITEYMDKLFICAIKLGALSMLQKEEYLRELFKNDTQELSPAILFRTEPSFDTATSNTGGELSNLSVAEKEHSPDAGAFVQDTPKKTSGEDWAKLTAIETEQIASAILSWADATPRKISIFYYRYLLCKNMLISKYTLLNSPNVWNDRPSIKVILDLLLDFGNSHPVELIAQEFEKLNSPGNNKPELSAFDYCPPKSFIDYQLLLSVMETIIAY